MNHYGNEIGFHNPKLSKRKKDHLVSLCPNLTFADSSWHNDLCDSLCVWIDEDKGIHYHIFLPNTVLFSDEDREKFKTFTLNFDNGSGHNPELILESSDVTEIANKLNELLN